MSGVEGKIADALNDILELNEKMASALDRISRSVGKEGKIAQRASIGSASGGWADCIESVNSLIGDLVQPSTEVARVIGAVAKGDLSQTMSLEVDGRPLRGEFLHTARVVNTMVDQLNSFASEATRVAREVGTEGKLGGQAVVTGVAGTWKDLTESVNSMASNLTNQVRNIAGVTTAVAKGDLTTQNYGGRARRNSGAEEHHQHHGGPAELVRGRSDARGARSRYGRPTGRAGGSEEASRACGRI